MIINTFLFFWGKPRQLPNCKDSSGKDDRLNQIGKKAAFAAQNDAQVVLINVPDVFRISRNRWRPAGGTDKYAWDDGTDREAGVSRLGPDAHDDHSTITPFGPGPISLGQMR